MPDPDSYRHVEIKDGEETVAAAEVTTSPESAGDSASVAARGGRSHCARSPG